MNNSVKCDVKNCKHNDNGCNCKLNSIKVTCPCKDGCTCCDDFCER